MGEPRRIIPISPAHALADQDQALYEVRRKIYPRAVTGRSLQITAESRFIRVKAR